MCGPLATFAISALSAVASFVGASQQAEATEDAARDAYVQDQKQISLRQMQEQNATAQKLQIQNIEEAKKRSEAELSGAESGVAGISIDNIISDVTRQAATNRQTERENLSMVTQQLQLDKEASRSRNQGRINQAAAQVNPLSLIAGVAGAGLDAYGAMS